MQYIEDADTEAPIEVVVAQCLPKGDKMEFIVQKAVELGASSVVPVVSRHCVVKYDEELGDQDYDLAPGVAFEDLPEDFVCPLCGVGKDQFEEEA